MSPRALLLLARIYLASLLVLSIGIVAWLGVDREGDEPLRSVVSVWERGTRRARTVVEADAERARKDDVRRRGTRVIEDVLDDGPVVTSSLVLFGASFVPLKDGVEVRLGDRVAYATVDDIQKLQAYDHFHRIGTVGLRLGIDPERVLAHLARELETSPEELFEEGSFRRVAMRRRTPREPEPQLTRESLRAAALAAGRYLARMVRKDGSYHYEVNAATGAETPDYNWPRHAGATWFLSDVAIYANDRALKSAAERAARRLAEYALVDCGRHKCIAEGDTASLGSSALALLALVEIVEGGLAPELLEPVQQLAAFLRSQQRPDGEFMHFYDRAKSEPVDRQVLYYTGEAALALSRAERVTRDKRNVDAARRALAVLVERPFWYVGWRYFWGAEHWTCHAMADLWDRAPNHEALQFCLDWQESVRNLAVRDREATPEYDGATSAGPFVPPQLGGSSSRMEAAVSTLKAAKQAGISEAELDRLEAGIRETFLFLMRFQFNPGPRHLFANPAAMAGGFPQSPANWKVRIDHPQHAGTGLLHYLEYLEKGR